jgi:cyclopropane fatty-acyl-phospholipid synthase-like methyltransferase
MADLDPRQVLRGGYDRIAARYAHWVADGPVDTAAVHYLQNLVEDLRPGAQVLDLGCGGGDRWPPLVDQFTLTGVDISFQQLRRARDVLPHARLIQADMTRLELPPAAFDAVVSLYAFNHLPFGELPHVLTSIAGWLRPGGLLLANMGTRHNRGTFEAGWLGVRMYFSGYTVDRSQAFVRAAGFQIQSAREETLWETIDGRTTPARFLWIVAEQPVT